MLEDDLSRICRLSINRQTEKRKLVDIKSYQELQKLCERGFALARLNGTVAWGTNPYSNMMYMSKGYHKRKLCDTGFFGIINTDLRFDPQFRLLDDTDMCARIIKRYGAFVSIDDYTAVHDRFIAGGCSEMWKVAGNKEKYVKMIMARHGDIFNCDLTKENSITLKRGERNGNKVRKTK